MKLIAAVALLALLALSAHLVQAQTCTDATCTNTVMVSQDFETIDCSGNSTFSVAANYTKSCQISEGSSYNSTVGQSCSSSAGYTQFDTSESNVCSASKSTTATNFAVGVCSRASATTSTIYWCNKNAASNKFKSVKAPTNETLLTRLSNDVCNVTTGECPSRTGVVKAYSGAGCALANVTQVLPASAVFAGGSLNLLIDTCYTTNLTSSTYDNRANIQATCANGRYTVTYSTGGCGASSNKFYSQSFPTDTCFLYSTETWVTITCPSAASALVTGLPLALFLLFAAFLLF